MNEKKIFEPAELKIISLARDNMLNASGELAEDKWNSFDFGSL